MKKLMTSTIILLPLLILAIMLVSGAIMSLITHIYVEKVEFVENGALVLVMDDESAPPTNLLEVNVLPLEAENRDLVYTVEDESIATVDENGVVTAQYYGETYITVTSVENKAAVDKRRVLVTDTSVHRVELNGGYKSDLYEGGLEERTQTLSVTVYPKEAENKAIEWKSSNEDILHVSANGTVTLRGAGKATVTATSVDNPDAFASVEITCHKRIESIEITRRRVFTALAEAQFPEVTKNPADADVTIAYTSSDSSVAKVDKTGKITFLKPGQVTITATATDFGGKTAEVSNDYVSTLGYYRAPLFDTKQFTVDYDEYKNADKALPIPFAANLADTYREVKEVTYSTNGVLTFDKDKEEFRFIGEMPAGVKTVTATVTATGYDTTTNELVSLVDAFTLTVLRHAQSVTVAYKGTGDANSIILSGNSLAFGTENAAAAVTVSPANHTDTVTYTLEDTENIATLFGSTIIFQKAGTVTMKIACLDEKKVETVSKTITVRYAPVAKEEHEKGVEITEPQPGKEPEKQQVSLSMDEKHKEEAVIYFTEPAGTTVTYEVTEGKNEVIELEEENGVRHIVPKQGGFATVEITVTKTAAPAGIAFFAARAGEETTVYTIEVYVDKPVTADSFTVEFGDKLCTNVFDTTLETVPFTVKAEGPNGELEGKLLYVSSDTTSDVAKDDGLLQFSGSVAFGKNLSSLTVTFGVKYSDRALSLGASGGLAFVTRTLKRNADSIVVSYNGTTVSTAASGTFNTTSQTLTFTTDAEPAASRVNVKIEPATYTERIHYSLGDGDDGNATLTGGVLTFKKNEACSVTVKIELRGSDGSATLSTQITIHYTPRTSEEKVVKLPTDSGAHIVLLLRDGLTDKAKIEFNAPANTKVTYDISDDEVLQLVEDNNEQTIVPKKGGFATVTVNVTPEKDSDEEEATYTINVYVDRAVTTDDFEITLNNEPSAPNTVFGTTLGEVPFTVTLNCDDGAMEGKRLYVKYGAATATAEKGATTFEGKIAFAETLSDLNVTFGVEYTDDTEDYKPAEGLAEVIRRLERNASSITVQYKGVEADKIVFGSNSNASRGNSITLGEGNADIVVTVSPAAHTDVLSYSLEGNTGNIATLGTNGTLTFTKAGTVTVVLQVKREDEVTLQKKFTVTYEPVGSNVAVTLGEGVQNEQYIALDFKGTGNKPQEAVLYFTAPAGKTVDYKVKNNAESIVSLQENNGVYHIVPKKGGFAVVEVALDGQTAYTVNVYVDKPVKAEDFTFKFNGNVYGLNQIFTTSLTTVPWSVAVEDKDGSMAGKQLVIKITGNDTVTVPADKHETDNQTATFTQDTLTFTIGAQYATAAHQYGKTNDGTVLLGQTTRKAQTTRGDLSTAPTVKYNDGTEKTLAANQENSLLFDDIGKEIVFTVDKNFDPSDFVLTKKLVLLEGHGYVQVTISDDGATIALKASKCVEEHELKLSIKNITYTLKVTIEAKAQTLTVKYGEEVLQSGQTYKTLLDSLTFSVTLGRSDGQDITNKNLEWSFDENTWHDVNNDSTTTDVEVDGIPSDVGRIIFRSKDGGAEFVLNLKHAALQDYALEFTVNNNNDTSKLAMVESAKDAQETIKCVLPSGVSVVTVQVTIAEVATYLGGLGTNEQFAALLPVSLNGLNGWEAEHNALLHQIVVTLPSTDNINRDIRIGKGGEGAAPQITVNFSRIQLAFLEFTGFDSTNAVDVYKGYQQVRVFAKKSYYKEADGDVDYFLMPVEAYKTVNKETRVSLSDLSWTLTKHDGKTGKTNVVTTQVGNTVYYNNATYTITAANGGYELRDSQGQTIVGTDGKYTAGVTHVTWVDTFSESESGYARIYFGGFTGLSETDVQNDYFGNFGDEESWNKSTEAAYSVEGKKVEPSEGAFSFLSVEGGDPAVGGLKHHFNFNVLADESLVNVFNATGYYAKNKIVLHNDLYGGKNTAVTVAKGTRADPDADCNKDELNGELYKAAKAKDLVLDKALNNNNTNDTSYACKNTIYGNGYQINLNALNTMIINSDSIMNNNGVAENSGHHSQFINIYNVNLKGRNDTNKVIATSMGVYFGIHNAYYSTIQNYGKLFDGSLHAKNTVFRNAAMAGIELWNDRNKTLAESPACVDYLENVTIVNAKRAIILENHGGHTLNIRGYLDALNYNSFNELKGLATGDLINDAMVLQILFGSMAFNQQSIDKYMEWFGSSYSVSLSKGNMDGASNFFVNPMIIDTSQDEGKTKIVSEVGKSKWGAKGAGWFYVGQDGNIVKTQKAGESIPNSENVWQWKESPVNVGGVGGVIKIWDESQHQYLDRKTDPGKSNFATPLSGLDHVDPRFNDDATLTKYQSQVGSAGFGNTLITGYTFNTPNTVDGGQCTVSSFNAFGFNAEVTRPDLGKLLYAKRDIRLLCEYLDIEADGTPILNTDHILWHMQKAYRDLSLVNREPDHEKALRESLKAAAQRNDWDGAWPDGTTLDQAIAASPEAAALSEMLSETVLPDKYAY